MQPCTMLWRRLDVAGHDACRLTRTKDGWQLAGAAVFQHAGEPACLAYRVTCTLDFGLPRAVVEGWAGARAIELRVARTAHGTWTLNGAAVSRLGACLDVDLGFTPATNALALGRLALAPGQAAEAPAAWLDVEGGLVHLPQRYERRSETEYWYESPSASYSALLEVDPAGLVRRYPGLWEREP